MPDTETPTGKFTAGRLLPFAAARPAPAASGEALSPPGACANCGTPLAGPYCSHCGQHVADFHRSVWRFVADFLDNTICWDNKLFRTLGPLFKRPGFLTREFMRGRRVSYVHPLRLFLFTSAVCLTLLQYSHHNMVQFDPGDHATRKVKRKINVQAPSPAPDASPGTAGTPAVAPDQAAAVKTAGAKPGDDDDEKDPSDRAIKRALTDKLIKAGVALKDQSDAGDDAFARAIQARVEEVGGEKKFSEAITNGIQQRLSWVALALLPVFALGLRAVFWRNERFYFEHLIFSLHYHTFLLLFWTGYTGVLAVAAYLPFHGLIEFFVRLCLLSPPVYLYVALRRMYGDGPKRTVVKVLLLGSMHLLAIVIGVAAVGAAAFFSGK